MGSLEQLHKMDFNANIAECTKAVHNIGSTTYVNVCSGAERIVSWGTVDWFLAGVFGLVGLVAVVLIIMFIHDITRDFR